MNRFISSINYPLSLIYSILISSVTWLIFSPGILSLDSLYMYLEAAHKFAYTDEKALLLPLSLSLLLKVGGSLSLLILFQCLAGFLAVRYLALCVSALFQIENKLRDLISLLVLFILSSPLSLLFIYLVTFWMDTWLGIILLLASGLLVELYFNAKLSPLGFKIRVLMLIFVISLALLVRLNAVILYPALCLALERVLHHRSVPAGFRLTIAFSPVLIFLSFMFFQYGVLNVARSHQEHTVYALDVASVLKYDPVICEKAILSACDVLSDDYPCNFVVGMGAVDCTYDQAKGLIYRPFYFLRNNSALGTDYWYIIREDTLTWLIVKFLNFSDYLRPVTYRYFYQVQDPGLLKQADLLASSTFSELRARIYSQLNWISTNPVLRWLSFVHLPWLIMDVLGIIACIVFALRSIGRDKLLFFALILSIPASYYFSYLIALTASDFRFMYPSTLVMQVITLTCLFSVVAKKVYLGKLESHYSSGE
jgi:hypothetical protein